MTPGSEIMSLLCISVFDVSNFAHIFGCMVDGGKAVAVI